MKRFCVVLGFAIPLLFAGIVQADDKWELGGVPGCVDDDSSNCNQLLHGSIQTHDLQGTTAVPDQDWMVVETKNRHSYEVRAFNANQPFQAPGCTGCTQVDRVNAAGTVLTAGIAPDGGGPYSVVGNNRAVRWIGAANQRDWIRVIGNTVFNSNAFDTYDIQLRETTYFVPRWNQSGSQSTVILLQNNTSAVLTGSLYFYDGAGVLLSTQAVSIPVNGLQGFSTAAIPALSGLSGSAAIAHLGPYGAITGKAVALEPGTGFTFDTPILPIPD